MKSCLSCIRCQDWGLLLWCYKEQEQIFHPQAKARFCSHHKTEEELDNEEIDREEVAI